MKKIVLVLTVALLGTIVMNAQPPRRHDMNPGQMVEKKVEHLGQALSLSDEQKAEIAKIYSEELKNMGKDRSAAKKDKAEKPNEETMKAKREQMRVHREATEAKIEAVLTPEQAAKYAELKKQEGRRGRGHHEGRRGKKDAPQKANCCDGSCECK